MTYGLQLTNTTGRALLGGGLKILRFKSKITGITPPHPLYYNTTTFNLDDVELLLDTGVTAISNPPVIYHVPIESNSADDIYANTSLIYKNGSWHAGFICKSPTVVTAYVFEHNTSPPSSGYGMQLFDAAGALTFDSNIKPLLPLGAVNVARVADVWGKWGSYTGWTLGSAVHTLPTAAQGKSIAIHSPAFYSGWIRGVVGASPQGGGGTPFRDFGIGGCRRFNNTLYFEAVYKIRTWSFIPPLFTSARWQNAWVSMIDTTLYD